MRGKVDYMQNLLDITRIIPAYAGKSITAVLPSQIARNHPRACGEKRRTTIQRVRQEGSPPRMRGKVKVFAHLSEVSGITPAYAGKSVRFSVTTSPVRDHPRVCGEKPASLGSTVWRSGSPPRMRGKGVQRDCPLVGMGITPAYAGKRQEKPWKRSTSRDHPRVCGEKFTKSFEEHGFVRITPAYAGKSLGFSSPGFHV